MLDENEYKDVQPSGDSEYHFASKDQSEPNFTEHIYQKPSYEDTHEAAPQFQPDAQFIPNQNLPKKEKEKKPVPTWIKIAALALCFSLIGGAVGSAITASLGDNSKKGSSSSGNTNVLVGDRDNVVIDVEKVDTSKQMSPAEVYATNVNSTVGITTSITTNYWGYQTTSAASGSGFIYSADGYILTNHHVIEGSSSITVSFYDGTSADAKLVGYDESNDIAVLKVDAKNLIPVTLGDSDNMNVGDTVMAIGNPLGELTFTLTSGIVSALGRQVTTSSGVTMTLIQTDCAINSGNSGGALFNLYGEVVGITNAKYSSSSNSEASIDNIGFAIPVNKIRSIVDSIITKGYYSKPYIGVRVTDVSAETQSYGLPQGAAVKMVEDGAPAAQAGLKVNDIITKVDGKEIKGSNDLVSIVGNASVGQVLNLTVYRMGAYIELKLTVGEQKQTVTTDQQQQQQQNQGAFNPFR
ncbi:MAG: trypsin-like peptidase domain-containing protein [Oscillospiraceae bacterium]|nr:trypsin-like peptidase domain-containing protein [Oscillospiraceae bacterium]